MLLWSFPLKFSGFQFQLLLNKYISEGLKVFLSHIMYFFISGNAMRSEHTLYCGYLKTIQLMLYHTGLTVYRGKKLLKCGNKYTGEIRVSLS